MEKSNLPPSVRDQNIFASEINPIWLATTFTLRRNLAKHNFPPKMNEQMLQQTLVLLKEQLLKSPHLVAPFFFKAEEVSPLDKQYLYEHFMCLESFQNTLAGQGFLVDNGGRFFAMLNSGNHIEMHLLDSEGSWEKGWNTLNQIETDLSSSLDFAFSEKFGYLTSDPANSGTALIVNAYLHLPALIHTNQLSETLLKQKEEGVIATGLKGSLEEVVGDLVILKNAFTLGVNEENILHSIESTAMKLMALEKTLRSGLQQENNIEIKDQISRAFGLLRHSYQLQTKEAMDGLSLLKLGLQLGWIEGISDPKLNTLLFQCRRAHLQYVLNDGSSDPLETARKRAEFLHNQLKEITIKI